MRNIVKINTILGYVLVIGIVITQLIITNVTFDIGRMAPFYAFLTAIIFFPFTITAIASVLRRKKIKKIKIGITIGLFLQVILPIFLPYIFDKEFIYLSLIGVVLSLITWFFRKNIELQLLTINGIGAIVWVLISLLALIGL